MRLLLIRHGQTPSNVQQLLDTAVPGPGLTELGQEQAQAVPAALAGEEVQLIVASTQVRAQLTAEPLARDRGLQVQIRDGVREIDAGDLAMRGDRESITRYLTTVMSWVDGDLEQRIPGGENGVEFFGRYDSVISEILATGSTAAAVISHGGAIRAWAGSRADNVSTDFVASNALSNTGVVVLDGDFDNGWLISTWAGAAIGGVTVDDESADGPAADELPDRGSDSAR